MTATYEAGKPYKATVRGHDNVIVYVFRNGTDVDSWDWWSTEHGWTPRAQVTDICGPQVILDPGNALGAAHYLLTSTRDGDRTVANEIKAQLQPPKPDEPENIASILEDLDHPVMLWIKLGHGPAPWFPLGGPPDSEGIAYSGFSHVKILHDGWAGPDGQLP